MRAAAELAGCDHKTVAHWVAAREVAGGGPPASVRPRPRVDGFRYRRLAQRAGALDGDEENFDERSLAFQRTVRDLLDTQRRELVRLRDEGEISDEVLHTVMRELDLEDQRLEI